MESRGRRGLHARGVRQGVLRLAYRGVPGRALPGARVRDPAPPRVGHASNVGPTVRSSDENAAPTMSSMSRRRSPARLVIALSIAAVLAIFLLYTSIAGG